MTRAVIAVVLALAADTSFADSAASPDFTYFGAAGPADSGRRVLLVAAIVNGKEHGDNLALWRDPSGLDLTAVDAFASAVGLEFRPTDDGGYVVTTPLGEATIDASTLQRDRNIVFVPLAELERALAAKVSFDESEYALRVDLPWTGGPKRAVPESEVIKPDIDAPFASLSHWRSELVATRSAGSNSAFASHRFSGGLGPGYWHADMTQSLLGGDSSVEIQGMSWTLDRGRSRWLIGEERLALHPLLPGFDMTGVQYAISNRPDLVYDAAFGADGQLVPYQARPTSVVRGRGPPGGTAELRYRGTVLARQVIPLSGEYEFRDVPAAPGDAVPIEVAIFAFGDTATPIRVEQRYSQAGALQLPQGASVAFVGAGQQGYVTSDTRPLDGNAGFFQYRRGLTRSLTGEVIIQSVDGVQTGVVGTAANLGPFGAWAAYLAHNDRADAHQLLGDGQRGEWFWRVNWLEYEAGYQRADAEAQRNVRAEAGRTFGERLRVSIVHAELTDQIGGRISFTRPAATWRPLPNVSLGARPEFDGRYAYDAQWIVRRGTRLFASSYGDTRQVALEQDLRDYSRLHFSAQHERNLGDRYAAIYTRSGLWSIPVGITGGVLSSRGKTGFVAEAGMEVYPGLTARLQALRDPLRDSEGTSFNLSLVADFAVTGAGLARAGVSPNSRQSGLSGSITLPTSAPPDTSLEGIAVLVAGRVAARSDSRGLFHVANLEPGVYRIELDNEGLPIELAVTDPPRNAEVRTGSVTRVDFHLALQLGLAGRVVDPAGNGVADLRVCAATTPPSQTTHCATTNRYGFYRIDELPPAVYRVVATTPLGATFAERTSDLQTRFLFGQDLAGAGAPTTSPNQ